MTKPRISLVLPAYNEAEHLRACLDAIAAQTVRPYEVIVVDNNSTDNTAKIAREYPWVRLLSERRQGVVFARNRGFNAARGDIIGRIDVDTHIRPDWIASVQNIFSQDNEIAAVSGVMHYYDIALPHVMDAIDLFFRKRVARALERTDTVFLQGASMAMKKSAWQLVRKHVCNRGGIHEDFDLAIHLQELGLKVRLSEDLHASLSARRIDVAFLDFAQYAWRSPHTYAQHEISSRRHMYHIVFMSLVGYIPGRILHRGYDPIMKTFSWRRVFTQQKLSRPDPTEV